MPTFTHYQRTSRTVASAGNGIWPFGMFRENNVPGCVSRLTNGTPPYLPGGPGLGFPYPIRNIRQVVVDLADDQYYSFFCESNLPAEYRIKGYDPIKIARSTRQSPPKKPRARSLVAIFQNGQRHETQYSESKIFLSKCKRNLTYFQSSLDNGAYRIIKRDLGKEKDPDFFGICGKCGDFEHTRENCHVPLVNLSCIYPLCLRSKCHLIKTCQTLHHICSACGKQGHREKHHESYTPIELKTFFDYFSPWGFYTCLLILDGLENVGFPIKNDGF